jgi:hypothetical protein
MENNNEEYISLYEYLGRSTKNDGEGLRVMTEAKANNIKITYKALPESLQTETYKSVAVYPVKFLDSIYKQSESTIVRRNEFQEMKNMILDIEIKLNKLLELDVKDKLENIIETEEDDLPF